MVLILREEALSSQHSVREPLSVCGEMLFAYAANWMIKEDIPINGEGLYARACA
jgi:hypothetical protein